VGSNPTLSAIFFDLMVKLLVDFFGCAIWQVERRGCFVRR
jgi:hypothetical protein